MKAKIKLLIKIIIGTLLIVQTTIGCQQGCLQCQVSSQTTQEVCTLCMDSYTLNTNLGVCVQKDCEQYQYKVMQTGGNFQCVSVCDSNSIANPQTNTCQTANTCSIQYVQPSKLSQGRLIQDTSIDSNGNLYVIYSNFINFINSQNSQFIRAINFDITIQMIKKRNNVFYLFSRTGQLLSWDPLTNSQELVFTLTSGIFNSESDFIQVSNNQNKNFVSSYIQQQNQIILTEVNQSSQTVISISYQYTAFIIINFIVLQNTDFSIQLQSLFENSNKQVILQNLTNNSVCTSAKGVFLTLSSTIVDGNTYLAITFAETSGICLVSLQNQQFTLQMSGQTTGKIIPNSFVSSDTSSPYAFFAASFSPNLISIYNIRSNKWEFLQSLNNSILDFQMLQISNSIFKFFILSGQFTIDTYMMSYEQLKGIIHFTYSTSLSVLISNPIQIQITSYSSNGSTPYFLCIEGSDIQLYDAISEQSYGILIDFKEKPKYSENKISAFVYLEQQSMSLSCSVDGKVNIWAGVDPLQPSLFQQLIRQESCNNIVVFQHFAGIAIYSSNIVVFNIFNTLISTVIPFNPQLYSSAIVNQNCFILIYNSQFSVWTDLSGQVFSQTFTEIAVNSFLLPSNKIAQIDAQNNIIIYQVNLVAKSITAVNTVKILPLISFIMPMALPSGSIGLMVVNVLAQLSIFDDSLNLAYPTAQIDCTAVILIFPYNSTKYFISAFKQGNPNLPFPLIELDLGPSALTLSLFSMNPFPQILVNIVIRDDLKYMKISVQIPIGSLTVIADNYYYSAVNAIYRAQLIQIQGDVVNRIFHNQSKSLYFATSTQTGNIQTGANNKVNLFEQFFTLPSTIASDSFSFLETNFLTSTLYVASKYILYVFNFHTLQEIDTFSFQTNFPTPTNSEAIKNIIVCVELGYFAAYSSQQVIVRNENQNTKYILSVLSTNSILKIINGCFFDTTSKKILVYGDIFVQFNLDLTSPTIISTPQQNQFTNCLFLTAVVICQINGNSIVLYNRQNQYQLISTLLITDPSLATFLLTGDEQNQNIILYNNIAQVYSYQGIFRASFTEMAQPIIKILITRDYIVCLTNGGGYIYNRVNLKFVTLFLPSGPTLYQGYYLEPINVIAYQTQEVAYGQIKFFSLDTLYLSGFVTSAQAGNGIGPVQKVFFDPENGFVLYMDTYGNLYVSSYGSQIVILSQQGIEQVQSGQTSSVIDFRIDLNCNQIFIYNAQYVWRFDYNVLIKQFYKFYKSSSQFYIEQTNSSNMVQLFYCDSQNDIFFYDNHKVLYQQRYAQQINDLRSFTFMNQMISVISLNQQMFVFIGQLTNLSNSNYQIAQSLLSYLLIDNKVVIVQTYDNKILDVDFVNNKINLQFQIAQNTLITSQFTYNMNGNWYLYLSLQNNQIIRIDLINKQYVTYQMTQLTSFIVKMAILSSTQLCIICNDGSSLIVNQSDMTSATNQAINNYIVSNTSTVVDLKSTNVPFFEVDLTNNRYFISMPDEVKMAVFNINTNVFISYIIFPDVQWKRMDFFNKYMILSNTYQLNFYLYNLSFVNRFRQLKYIQLTDIQAITDDIFVIVFLTQLQIISVNSSLQQITSMNIINVQNAHLVNINLLSQSQVQIVAIHKTGVLDQVLSINYINQQNQLQVTGASFCLSSINYSNYLQASNDFSNQYAYQYNLPMQYQLQVLINNSLEQMSFLNQKNVQFVIRPQSVSQTQLNLKSYSFLNILSDIKLSSFDFILSDQLLDYTFTPSTQNIAICSSTLSNQNIQTGTRIYFSNLSTVQITDFSIQNLNLIPSSSTGSNSNNNNNSNGLNQYQSSSLFYIENTQYVLIENLTIQNLSQQDNTFTLFIFSNVNKVVINQLTIQNSNISGQLFNFIEVNSLRIQNIKINNCQLEQPTARILQTNSLQIPQYIFNLQGIQLAVLLNFQSQGCKNISILKSSNMFNRQGFTKTLTGEYIYFISNTFEQNTFPTLFSKDVQLHIITIQNSFVSFQQLIYNNNQGNIYVTNSGQFELDQSQLKYNKGVNGGCIQLESITQSATITQSTFTNNKALANGGALLITDVQSISIDKKSIFSNNIAQIGGAIRVMITTMNNYQQIQNLQQNILSVFQDNLASIFGNNIGTYPKTFQIFINQQSQSSSNRNLQRTQIYEGDLFQDSNQQLQITGVQSGGNIELDVLIYDEYGQQLMIDQTLLNSNQYSLPIQNELNYYLFEFSNNNNDPSLEIKGDSFLTSKQFITSKQAFTFQSLSLSGMPLSTTSSLLLKLRLYSWLNDKSVSSNLSFRNCIRGEVYIQETTQITICKQCSIGTYSLLSPLATVNDISAINSSDQVCKKCPTGSSFCQSDIINLEVGYWRENNLTDLIIECNQFEPFICDSNTTNINGCMEGHVGPLCESCDFDGSIWGGSRYAQSLKQYECQACSGEPIQIFYIVVLLLTILAYLLITVYMFMRNYFQNSFFTYMRVLKILPYSKSCISDESTFFIKTFLNYLQISYILINLNFNFIPTTFAFVPSFAGQPVGKLVVSSSCLYAPMAKSLDLGKEIELRAIIFIFLPLFFFMALFILFTASRILKLRYFKITSYHTYTMLNILFFFFQPDSISFYVQTLTCRQIGENSYVTTSLNVLCSDESFAKFKGIVIIPVLIFWIAFPLVILFKFIRDRQKDNHLHYCTMKYKYGYYYLEYKKIFCFWEFIRIYQKIFVVLVSSLLGQTSSLPQTICIVVFTFYICGLRLYSPFDSKQLNRQEAISYIVIIVNLFLNQLNQSYPSTIIEIIMMTIHYTQIFFFILIIAKIKLFQTDSKTSDMIKHAIKKCLPSRYYNKLIKKKVNKIKVLLRWKMIFHNLALIRQNKVTQQIEDIIQHQRKRNSTCVSRNKQETFHDLAEEIRSKVKSFDFLSHQSMLLSPKDTKDDARTLNTEKQCVFDSQASSPSPSPLPFSKNEKVQKFFLTINSTERNQLPLTHKKEPSIVGINDYIDEVAEFQSIQQSEMSSKFQNDHLESINADRGENESIDSGIPNQIYTQKFYKSNIKNKESN